MQQVLVVVGRDDHREADVLALGLLEFQHRAQGVVKAVLEAALGIVDLGQALDAHADEDVGIFIGQLNDFLGIVTVGAEFEKS